jgi:hypothetical protein
MKRRNNEKANARGRANQTTANDGIRETKYRRYLLRLFAIIAGLLPGGLILWWATGLEVPEMTMRHRASTDREQFAISADIRVLMVGNSLTYYNNLDQLVEKLAESTDSGGRDVFVARIAPSGYKIVEHRSDLLDENRDPPLRQVLVSGPERVRDWDFVILQAQSQTPGFSRSNSSTRQLFSAAAEIHDIATKGGATTVLLMTWGFWNGDAHNVLLYPDFLTMSRRLETGYFRLARKLTSWNGERCLVAPAGVAFRAVFEDEIETGIDPKSRDSLFRGLYADDRHPTLAGSYLAAAVVVAKIMAVSIQSATWVPDGLDRDVAARLRRIADEVVIGGRYEGRKGGTPRKEISLYRAVEDADPLAGQDRKLYSIGHLEAKRKAFNQARA